LAARAADGSGRPDSKESVRAGRRGRRVRAGSNKEGPQSFARPRAMAADDNMFIFARTFIRPKPKRGIRNRRRREIGRQIRAFPFLTVLRSRKAETDHSRTARKTDTIDLFRTYPSGRDVRDGDGRRRKAPGPRRALTRDPARAFSFDESPALPGKPGNFPTRT
jgi:hypothetical protein